MKYLKKFNEMLDPMGNWNPSQLNGKHEECEECDSYPCQCNEYLRKAFEDDPDDEEPIKGVNYQVKNEPPDEVCPNCDCIPCQCTGDECEECGCFPCECNDDIKENTQHKEGTFAYYNAMTKEELKSLQKTFKHDFENPAQHDPKFVAYLKACELKKVFKDKDQTPRNLKSNKMY